MDEVNRQGSIVMCGEIIWFQLISLSPFIQRYWKLLKILNLIEKSNIWTEYLY